MKKGFTLAEVLITLGIIGVVAAMTMPMLIAKYENLILSVQLKKNVSRFENGFKKMLADSEVNKMEDIKLVTLAKKTVNTSFSGSVSNYCGYFNKNSRPQCIELRNELKKYFNITDFVYQNSNDYDLKSNSLWRKAVVFRLNTGERISLELNTSGSSKINHSKPIGSYDSIGSIQIDVNGPKGPNKWGRDNFYFRIRNDGSLRPGDPGSVDGSTNESILKSPTAACGHVWGTFFVYYNNYNITCTK